MKASILVGVRGQIVGLVGSFYECSKKGKPKSHIKVYELQIDELIKKWPGRKKRDRRWVSLKMKEVEKKNAKLTYFCGV